MAIASSATVAVLACAVLIGVLSSSNPVDAAQIVGTIIAAVTLVGVIVTGLWRWGPAAFSRQRSTIKDLTEGGNRGLVPRLSQVSLSDLGVRDPRDALGGAQSHLPYASRHSLDPRLQSALRDRRFVLVHGPSAAGKSRSTVQAAIQVSGDRPVLIPVCRTDALQKLLAAGAVSKGALIWLSDLQEHIAAGVDAALLEQLLDIEGVTVVATIRDGEYQRLVPHEDLRPQGRDVIELAIRHHGLVSFDGWDEIDRDQAANQYSWLQRTDVTQALKTGRGLGEYLVAGPELIERLQVGQPPASGIAVVRAATDWYRAGLTRPAPLNLIRELYPAYLPADDGAQLVRFEEGLIWACDLVSGTRTVTQMTDGTGLVVHDYVLDHWPKHYPRPIPDVTWAAIAHEIRDRPKELVAAGSAAAEGHQNPSAAIQLLRPAVDLDNVFAMYNLGVVLVMQGESAEAERLWRRAADAGLPDAMYNLGVLLSKRGDDTEAVAWWEKVAASKDVSAMYNLGIVEKRRGNLAASERWWRMAAEAGQTDAARNLAGLLQARGELVEAERWFYAAVEEGDAKAMNNLGALYAEQDDLEAAAQWWAQAAACGIADAMNNLAVVAKAEGDLEAAERWWRDAVANGHVQAMEHLAFLAELRDDLVESESWRQRAAEHGLTSAMNDLAVMLHGRGEDDQAERWWRAAAEAQLPEAMNSLAVLLLRRGEVEEAERLWQTAAAAGLPHAINSLAFLLQARGNHAEAEAIWRKAAMTGLPAAMNNLGTALRRREEYDEADEWWRNAAEAGDTDAMFNLGVSATARGAHDEAERWWQQAAAAGDTASANAIRLDRPPARGSESP